MENIRPNGLIVTEGLNSPRCDLSYDNKQSELLTKVVYYLTPPATTAYFVRCWPADGFLEQCDIHLGSLPNLHREPST